MTSDLFDSAFPPDPRTFAGAISLRLASGAVSVDEVIEEFSEIAGDVESPFLDDEPIDPIDVPGIVAAVAAEYRRCVMFTSADARALINALDRLADARILYVYGEGRDVAESLEAVTGMAEAVAENGVELRGALYSTLQDLERMIMDGRLVIRMDDRTGADDGALIEDVVALLNSLGLTAGWTPPERRIVVDPIHFRAPLVTDEETPSDAGPPVPDPAVAAPTPLAQDEQQ
ncbi:DUF6891 domain-containing protein [Nigerium massiliense]|uniref:DUF6891 domain-containing protein n=1 Tax=Nigerium massiliense TaxID=1522317 RepID=UPI000591143D|nr:hypothetical protein [Nigerium massiliense]